MASDETAVKAAELEKARSVAIQIKLGRRLMYKKAAIIPATAAQGLSLAQHIALALGPLEDPADRTMVVGNPGDEQTTYVLNEVIFQGGAVFGELLKYQNRASQAIVTNNVVENRRAIRHEGPPDDGDYMKGLLFFYVRDNEVVFMTTNSFRDPEALKFLRWLLQERTQQLPNCSLAMMQATFEEFVANSHDLHGLRSITLHASAAALLAEDGLGEPAATSATAADQHGNKPVKRSYEAAHGLSDLTKAVINERTLPSLDLDEALDIRPLTVSVRIELSGSTRSDSPILDALLLATRTLGGVNCDLELRNGTRIKGEHVTVSTTKPILHENGYPLASDAIPVMRSWLGSLVSNGVDVNAATASRV